MELAGDVLQSERLRRGLSLAEVAAKTKIGVHLLQAIESNRFDLLPGGLFPRCFLRQYARVLNVDEMRVLVAFDEQFKEAPLALPPPLPKSPNPRLRFLSTCMWLALTIVASGAAYGIWQDFRADTEAKTMPQHRRTQPAAANPDAAPAQTSSPAQAQQTPSVRTPDSGMHVVFTAKDPVWVSIQSDGKPAFTGTLDATQSKELDASAKVVALVGNAGGLTVSLNGKEIGLIGEHGEVRVLELTPTGFHIGLRRSAVGTTVKDSKSPNPIQQF